MRLTRMVSNGKAQKKNAKPGSPTGEEALRPRRPWAELILTLHLRNPAIDLDQVLVTNVLPQTGITAEEHGLQFD